MTLKSDCPLLPFFFSCYLFLSTLILLFPGSFLLFIFPYFLPCPPFFSYSIVSWLVWAALLGYFFGLLWFVFFPWLVLNKTKSSRLHSGVVPCCVLLPHLILLDLMTRILQSQPQTPMLIVVFLFYSFNLLSSDFCFFFLSLPPGNCSSCLQA